MDAVQRIEQLYSDESGPCPTCEKSFGVSLTQQANHLIGHGWRVLHIGQETTTDGATGDPVQRTTIVLGEPEEKGPKRSRRMADSSDLG